MTTEHKDIAFIVSSGRTGTQFFAETLPRLINDCFAVHEPDVLHLYSDTPFATLRSDIKKVRTFGLYHAVIGKILGQTGIRRLSEKHLLGRLEQGELIGRLRRHRLRYFATIEQPLVIESSYQWFGLVDVIPLAFPGAKIVGIVRDPRKWAASWLVHGGHHDARDVVSRLGFSRIDSAAVATGGEGGDWQHMSTLEKLCWDWRLTAQLFDEHLAGRDFARIVRFEDIFEAPTKQTHFRELLKFLTTFEDRTYSFDFTPDVSPDVLAHRVNPSAKRTETGWEAWPEEDKATLERICGPLMTRFGYR